MSLEENKAIVRRWIDACNERSLSLLDELIAPDFFHPTWQLRGAEGYKQLDTNVLNAFPDWHTTIEGIIAEGDKVWVHLKGMGTHKGEFRGLAPTGKKITWEAVSIWRIVDGKIVERKSVVDMLDFLKQLGVIEYTEKAKKLFPDEILKNC